MQNIYFYSHARVGVTSSQWVPNEDGYDFYSHARVGVTRSAKSRAFDCVISTPTPVWA